MTISSDQGTSTDDAGQDASPRDDVVVCTRGSGTATWALGSLYEKLVSAGQTAGQLGVSIVTQPPGMASPLHVHTREAEAWFILGGTMTYVADGKFFELAAGDFIYLPRGVPHGFRTTGSTAVRFLALAVPGQLLDLYDEVGSPATERRIPDGGAPPGDIARWAELAPQYGLRIVGPPLAETEPVTRQQHSQ